MRAILSRKCGFRPVHASGVRAAAVGPVAASPRPAASRMKMSWSVITSDSMRSTSVMCVIAARAVDEPRDLDEQVERARDLLADRAQRQVDAGRQHERLEPGQRVARGVGVDRRQRALVARVHRLEHVQGLGAADLADDDPVGAHAQGVPDELADADLALALDVRRPRLERDHVLLLELELGGVLDRDDALVARDEGRDRVQRRRLTGAGTAGDEDVQLARARRRRGTARPCGVSVPNLIRSSIVYGSRANFRIVSVGPRSASGGMIAFTRLPSGRRASTIGDDSSMRRPTCETILSMIRSRCALSANVRRVLLELAVALDEDPVEVVDHDLGHGVVAEQRLERPVAEDVVGDLADDAGAAPRA